MTVQESQAAVSQLRQEKDIMQRTLLAAGLPFPQLPNDFAPSQAWMGVAPLGIPNNMATASIPPVATPSSAYSAFSVPFGMPGLQAQGSGFKPCHSETPMSQSHYIVPSSGPLLTHPRGTAGQAPPEVAMNGNASGEILKRAFYGLQLKLSLPETACLAVQSFSTEYPKT